MSKKEIHALILEGKPTTEEEQQQIMNEIFTECIMVANRYFPKDKIRAQRISLAFCHIVKMAIPWNKQHKAIKRFFSSMN